MTVRVRRSRRAHVALAWLLLPAVVQADWINLSGAENAPNVAEIEIRKDAIDIALEVYPDDLRRFETADGIAFSVRADGVALQPRVLLREQRTRIDRYSPYAGMIDRRTRRQVPGPPADKNVTFIRLSYPLAQLPQQVTFAPPMDADGSAVATVGFLVYHKSAPVIDFRYLSQPEMIELDWDDPWYSAFENKNLARHHKWPQMSFLYIEPREVRHELLLRVRDVIDWTKFEPAADGTLSGAEKSALRRAAIDFSESRNPVTIDQKRVAPDVAQAEFLAISPGGLQVIEADAAVDISSAIIGISQSYWVERLPQTAAVQWELFDERIQRVPCSVTDPAGPFPDFVTPEAPQIEWQNFLKDFDDPAVQPVRTDADHWLDWAALQLKFFGKPADDSAALIVGELLRNTAIAYVERNPEALDRVLDAIVASGSKADMQPSLAQAFAVSTRGGGIATVSGIADLQLDELGPDLNGTGFSAVASWTAAATGRHWGHIDDRRLNVRAIVDVGEFDGNWKLTGFTLVELALQQQGLLPQ